MFKSITNRHFPLLVLVLANLIIGLFILPGFGESVDELSLYSYAERTIDAVQSFVNHGVMTDSFIQEKPQQGSHGPAFMMTATLLRNFFLPGGSMLEKLNFGHYLYFMVFQVGVISIFFLSRRWVGETAALGTALLFNTQPVLLGHAFINATDIVFMSLMSASAALGLGMLDRGGKSSQATGHPLWDGFRSFMKEFLYADVWLAGLVLGFSSAIRIAAPLVGVIIFVHILLSRRWQVLPRFLAYGLIAFCFMILFWPYLWPDPVGRLIASVSNSANYPDVHLTLFRGVLFDAKDIPRSYLPVLLSVQLTETTLVLILLGVLSLLKRIRWDFVALVLIWFALPAVVVILARVHLYNNFRQVSFILPPLFLMAGLGLEWLFMVIRRPVTRSVILFLVLLPGLFANITLYPYQYIYYNQLVGGVSGAYRNFDLDYWNLAFKDAQVYINQAAGKNANIYVDKSRDVVQPFARPDLVFNAYGAKDLEKYDFIIVSTSRNLDQRVDGISSVFVIERYGVPLAFVKKP